MEPSTENTANVVSPTTTLGDVVPAVTPLRGALNNHGSELDKLHNLVAALANRLEGVRQPLPPSDDAEKALASPTGSVVTDQVRAHTSIVKDMQKFVSHVLDELEV